MSDLELGRVPRPLEVFFVPDDDWTAAITLSEHGEHTTWPQPPTLVFPDGTTWTAVLSDDDATATWSAGANQVAPLIEAALAGGRTSVRLRVGSSTWWAGKYVVRG